jgi:hypothetical protein
MNTAQVGVRKPGPELLDDRLALYDGEQRMVFGANTYRAFAGMQELVYRPTVH